MAHPVIIKKGLRRVPTIVPKGLGYVPKPKRKFAFDTYKPKLPASFADYRLLQKSGPTLDQTIYPACVGFAFTSNQMRDEKMEHGVYYFSSADALDLYLECKKIDGYAGDGTYGEAACEVLLHRGVRASGRWILTIPNVWTSAVWQPFATPRLYKIKAYKAQLNDLNELCALIDSTRRTVLVGMAVDGQIFDPPATGVLPDPNGGVVGGHELEIYGYKTNLVDSAGQSHGLCFALKNSWGNYWGGGSGLKGGRIWMPASWFNRYLYDFYTTEDVRPD